MARFEPHPERRPVAITGASSGIGAATAHVMAESGHPVILGARRLELCEALAKSIRSEGGEAVALPLDLDDADSTTAFAKQALEVLGNLEILVSNAGHITPATAIDTAPDEFDRVVRVNLTNAHRLCSLVAASMVERRRGDLVFVTSDAVRAPRPFMASYVASKWGIEGYARAMQMELEGTGVRVSMIRPDQTMTGMGQAWDPEVTEVVLAEWSRWGFARHSHFLEPDAIAAAVEFCVSAPPGVNVSLMEVRPEAPIRRSNS